MKKKKIVLLFAVTACLALILTSGTFDNKSGELTKFQKSLPSNPEYVRLKTIEETGIYTFSEKEKQKFDEMYDYFKEEVISETDNEELKNIKSEKNYFLAIYKKDIEEICRLESEGKLKSNEYRIKLQEIESLCSQIANYGLEPGRQLTIEQKIAERLSGILNMIDEKLIVVESNLTNNQVKESDMPEITARVEELKKLKSETEEIKLKVDSGEYDKEAVYKQLNEIYEKGRRF